MIMKKNEKPSFLRGRGAAVGIVICFVAVIAMVGTYTFNNYQKQIDEQVAKAEGQAEKLTEDNSEETTADDIVLPENETGTEEEGGTEGISGTDTSSQETEDTGTQGAGQQADTGSETEETAEPDDETLYHPRSVSRGVHIQYGGYGDPGADLQDDTGLRLLARCVPGTG